MWRFIIILLGTGGFAGNIPVIGGTLGAIEGAFISLIFNSSLWLKGMVLIILFITGVHISGIIEKISGIKDNHSVVIDELIGGVVATFFLPPYLWVWIAGMVFFRLFDWIKPFPIHYVEKMPGGIGVVGDDIIAGLYSLGMTWIIYGCRNN